MLDDLEHICDFEWEILNPFVPWVVLNTTFYDGTPPVTRWKVILQPLGRRMRNWDFALSLEFDPTFEEREEVVANRAQMDVCLNDEHVDGVDDSLVWFGSRNSYTYRFVTTVSKLHLKDPDRFVVKIKLHLPDPVNQYQNINERNDDNPRLLSQDLLQLVNNPLYSNMKLRSADGYIFDVHSYIIRARWSNFFTLIPFNAGPEVPIETNIWGVLLWDILTYMYSGILNFGLAHWANPSCAAELFHVIHLYKLYHLYKVLFKNDLNQKRVTKREMLTKWCILSLEGVLGRPNLFCSWPWAVNENTPLQLLFRIRVQSTHGPWLSYSLESKSELLIYAEVNLEIKKITVINRGTEILASDSLPFMHQRNYTIPPNEVADSGAVLLLGSSETFNDFGPVDRHGNYRAVRYIVRCFLKFSDGGTIDLIQSKDNMFHNDPERFNLLGDHLLQLRNNPLQSDLRVVSSVQQEWLDSHEIHKAIFAARVKHWWELLQDVEAADEMPDEATSVWGSEALKFALDYIYTSRVFDIPNESILAEIEYYAYKSGCTSLSDLVYRTRYVLSCGSYA